MMKLFTSVVVVSSLGVGAAIVITGRNSKTESRPAAITVASPAESFVVHDAPPATQAAPSAAAPSTTPAQGASLDATIERLRAAAAAQPEPAPPVSLTITPPPATPDPLLSGSNPAPSILAGPPPAPPQAWSAVTSQGVRWRSSRDISGPLLVIDMGGARVATVEVDPAFQALAPAAAGARVDFLKQTILESFPPGASRFRFGRDGSVALLR